MATTTVENVTERVPSKLKHIVYLIILILLYRQVHLVDFDYNCNDQSSSCIEKKQNITLMSILRQIVLAVIICFGVWQLFYILGSNPSTMFASAGISVAILGLSFKPLLDEYIQGTHLIFQNRVKLYDKVHIFTKFGRWYPELHEDAVTVVNFSPTFLTLRLNDGTTFTLNTTQVNGFKLLESTEYAKDMSEKSSKHTELHKNKDNDTDDNHYRHNTPDPILELFQLA